MVIPNTALLLAGFVLAHAAWNVSDLPKGELLVPLAVVEKNGKRTLSRFEAQTQAEAIDHGKSAMKEATQTDDTWAFAYDGLLPEKEGKIDVIIVEFWAKGMDAPCMLIQRYEPFFKKDKFRLICDPEVVIGGIFQKSEQVKNLLQIVRQGISQHPKVNNLWAGWQSKLMEKGTGE